MEYSVIDTLGLLRYTVTSLECISSTFDLFKSFDPGSVDPDLEESFKILRKQRQKLTDLWVDLSSESAFNEGIPF